MVCQNVHVIQVGRVSHAPVQVVQPLRINLTATTKILQVAMIPMDTQNANVKLDTLVSNVHILLTALESKIDTAFIRTRYNKYVVILLKLSSIAFGFRDFFSVFTLVTRVPCDQWRFKRHLLFWARIKSIDYTV